MSLIEFNYLYSSELADYAIRTSRKLDIACTSQYISQYAFIAFSSCWRDSARNTSSWKTFKSNVQPEFLASSWRANVLQQIMNYYS